MILAPWGETIVDARCFEHGGVCEATYGPHNRPYRVAGMQQAVNVMRAAGYRGLISIPGGITYSPSRNGSPRTTRPTPGMTGRIRRDSLTTTSR